jgi:hypothetical protein
MRPRHAAGLLLPVFLAFLSACVEPVQSDTTAPISLAIVSGSGQTGAVGVELHAPLVVRVTRSDGRGPRRSRANW